MAIAMDGSKAYLSFWSDSPEVSVLKGALTYNATGGSIGVLQLDGTTGNGIWFSNQAAPYAEFSKSMSTDVQGHALIPGNMEKTARVLRLSSADGTILNISPIFGNNVNNTDIWQVLQGNNGRIYVSGDTRARSLTLGGKTAISNDSGSYFLMVAELNTDLSAIVV
jgi:hypothetical protein